MRTATVAKLEMTGSPPRAGAEERELLSRARTGDREAQTVLYEKHIHGSAPIRSLLRRAVQDEALREDLLHEIFLAATRSAGEFRGDSQLGTYLYRVAQLTILEHFRAANTQKRGGLVRLVPDSTWAENPAREPHHEPLEYEEVETRLALERLMAEVPDVYREALRMRVVEELDYQQIAARLAIPVETVGTRIFKGKALLVGLLRKAGFGPNQRATL